MAVLTTRQRLRTLNLSARQLKDMTRDSGSEWSDNLVNDYLTIFSNLVTVSTATDDLEPLTGNGDPNEDSIISNGSHVFYRIYTTGDIKVVETWFNPDVGESSGWIVTSSFSELESL